MINRDEATKRITARSEEFLRELFGESLTRSGSNEWCDGTLVFKIKKGQLGFRDLNSADCGDCIALWMRERVVNYPVALEQCAAWAGVTDDGSSRTSLVAQKAGDPSEARRQRLSVRPPEWPALDNEHLELWYNGVRHLQYTPHVQNIIAQWRGWPAWFVRALGVAGLMSAMHFNRWGTFIEPQNCVAFPVYHPFQRILQDGIESWGAHFVQLQARFLPGAKWREGSELTWISTPSKRELNMEDGSCAPLIITHDGSDPEQPILGTKCECVIICPGEWDALTVLLAANWIDPEGKLSIPSGLAIVGIRGERKAGTDAYLRYYAHWKPQRVIMLPKAGETGETWFTSQNSDPSFCAQLESRGAEIIDYTPPTEKDINDSYRAGNFGAEQVDALLKRAGFPFVDGRPAKSGQRFEMFTLADLLRNRDARLASNDVVPIGIAPRGLATGHGFATTPEAPLKDTQNTLHTSSNGGESVGVNTGKGGV